MLGIHRTVRKVALMAAAAVLAGSFSAQSARATLVYGTGFENPPFSTTGGTGANGNVSGQDGWSLFSNVVGTPSSTAIIVANPTSPTGGVDAGSQSLQISRAASEELGASPTFNQSIVGNTVTVDVRMNYTASSAFNTATVDDGPFGPFFGIKINGNAGLNYLGGFGVDASTGQLLFDDGSGTFPTIIGALHSVLPGSFNEYSLSVTNNGTNIVLSAAFNGGAPITLNSTILSANDTSFSQGYLFGGAGAGDVDSEALTSNAFFDTYSVNTTESVPEPASVALLGLAAIGLCGRRTRQSVVPAL